VIHSSHHITNKHKNRLQRTISSNFFSKLTSIYNRVTHNIKFSFISEFFFTNESFPSDMNDVIKHFTNQVQNLNKQLWQQEMTEKHLRSWTTQIYKTT